MPFLLLCSMSVPHYVFPLLLHISCHAGNAQVHEEGFGELEILLAGLFV